MHLPVAHYPQEQKSTCLPAYFRIVLSYLRIEADELSLSRRLGTGAGGTPTDNFALVEMPGVSIIAQHMLCRPYSGVPSRRKASRRLPLHRAFTLLGVC